MKSIDFKKVFGITENCWLKPLTMQSKGAIIELCIDVGVHIAKKGKNHHNGRITGTLKGVRMDIRPSHTKCGQGLHLRGQEKKGQDGTILRCSPEQTGELRQEQDRHKARIDQNGRYHRRAGSKEAAFGGGQATIGSRVDRGRNYYQRADDKEAAAGGSQIKRAGRIRHLKERLMVVSSVPQFSQSSQDKPPYHCIHVIHTAHKRQEEHTYEPNVYTQRIHKSCFYYTEAAYKNQGTCIQISPMDTRILEKRRSISMETEHLPSRSSAQTEVQ